MADNTPRPELGGRTPKQVSDSERFTELGCLGFVLVLALLAGWLIAGMIS